MNTALTISSPEWRLTGQVPDLIQHLLAIAEGEEALLNELTLAVRREDQSVVYRIAEQLASLRGM